MCTQVLLTNALAAEWTPAQAAVLRRVSGTETVHEAVTRTSLVQACACPEAVASSQARCSTA